MFDHPKTEAMFEILDKGALVHYRDQSLYHNNISYKVLTGRIQDVSTTPVVSIGSAPLSREIIALDPNNSPLLQQKYAELPGVTFEEISDFIRLNIFHAGCTERKINAFVLKWLDFSTLDNFALTEDNSYLPVIPLDAFIEAGIGACRHASLVAFYFLDRLIKEGRIPPGKVHYVRDVIKFGGHAWILYLPQDSDDVWHIDPQLAIIKNCRTDIEELYEFYGQTSIDRQMKRFKTKIQTR